MSVCKYTKIFAARLKMGVKLQCQKFHTCLDFFQGPNFAPPLAKFQICYTTKLQKLSKEGV